MDPLAQELPNLLQGQLDGLNAFFNESIGATYDSDWAFHAMFIETSMKALTIGMAAVAGVESLAQGPEYNVQLQIANERLAVLNTAIAEIGPPLASISQYEEAWSNLYWATSDCIAALRTAVNRALIMIEDQSVELGPLGTAVMNLYKGVDGFIQSGWDKAGGMVQRLADYGIDQAIDRAPDLVDTYYAEMSGKIEELKAMLLSEVESRAKKGAISGVVPLLIGAGVIAMIAWKKR